MSEEMIKEIDKTRKNVREKAIALIREGKTLKDKELCKLFDLQDLLSEKIKELKK